MSRMLGGLLLSFFLVSSIFLSATALSSNDVSAIQLQQETTTNPINEYTSYFGGSNIDWSFFATLDDGNLILIGDTSSTNFPLLNAYQDTQAGGGDTFIAKFDSQHQLVFASYFGGSDLDRATGMCLDSDGNIITVGLTESSDFPVLNPLQGSYGGGTSDGYFAKFSPTGDLLYSSYYGGSGTDWLQRVVCDEDDNLLTVGTSTSSDIGTTPDVVQPNHAGNNDIILLKLSSDGQTKEFCTYFGSSTSDMSIGVQYDRHGNLVVFGAATSGDNTTTNAYQETYGGGTGDVIIIKLDSDAETLQFATLLGGEDWDFSANLGFDSENNIIVSGYTYSSLFPTMNPYQEEHGGINDAFVSKLSANGEELLFSTFIGGEGEEQIHGGTFLDDGSVVLSGYSTSDDYPLVNALQDENQGGRDACIIHLEADGQSLRFSTLLGGDRTDSFEWVDVDSNGNYVLVGFTASTDLPITNAYQSEYGGSRDVLISVISTTSQPLDSDLLVILGVLSGVIILGVVLVVFHTKRR